MSRAVPAFDPARKYVRVRRLRADGFVEFDFAVGEPEIFVEMLLGSAAFDEFCSVNRVSFLAPETASAGPADAPLPDARALDWRLSDARLPGA
ncbi:phenol hydroxylase subunit [Derxia gummosa]|uniref:Phenol hydroxylase subunit n=1 Tax=Derxia gummosa DSM 723 TaxID=1121388 RepID=A0A9U5CCD5_9BURK|nr:phenol hydroxylase subunit [Derxia gummosa]